MSPAVSVRRISHRDVDELSVLFDRYRQFYNQPANLVLANRFVTARFEKSESILLGAWSSGPALDGFLQIYPSFCSVSAAPLWILYDLFVHERARRSGVGRALLAYAADLAAADGAARIELATATTNVAAQRLYESSGYIREVDFFRYKLQLAF
jgi:ribosomal protein S18 acetylase RimI-like enzyme